MESYAEIFRDEAMELLVDLEKSLLMLEEHPEDVQSIDRVFRVMHTLKGNSRMFGFENIEDITHHLENIYDNIRSGRYSLREEILSITLETLDHIRKILSVEEIDDANVSFQHKLLLNKLKQVCNDEYNESNEKLEYFHQQDEITGPGISTFLISFAPHSDFLQDGSNPIYILEDLCALGEVKILSHTAQIPALSKLEPTSCYLSWTIVLVSNRDLQEVLDIFIFAEQNSEVNVRQIAGINLIQDDQFAEKLQNLPNDKSDFDILVELAEKTKTAGNNSNDILNYKMLENKISSIRVSSDKLDQLMNLVSELVTLQARFNVIANEFESIQLESVKEEIEKLARQLRENTLSICLIPINSIEIRFQRLVRDLSLELGKEVKFNLEGGSTELDKNIIESLSEPLLHILRNSLDHGIELPEDREKKGKKREGSIRLKAYYSGANVFIEIEDDGAGIDLDMVKRKGIEKRLFSTQERPTEKDIYKLLFHPGFSTSKNITNVSGRGVGMDIVKRKIEYLQGEVSVTSKRSKGTTITIKLPLSLSIIDGLLVSIGNTKYVIPIDIIDKLYEVSTAKITSTFNHLVELDGNQLQFINLKEELNINGQVPDYSQIVLVKYEDKNIGLCFDKLHGEYQAVLKPLGKLFDYQEFISGGTILGDGSVALILDTNKIINQLINDR